MFSRHRISRGPEKPTNASAVAAASAIGRALGSNGKTVDKTKLPEYNRSPGFGSRSSSLGGSRRSSLQLDGPLSNRNGSSGKAVSPDDNSLNGIRRRTSVKSSTRRSNSTTRSHSLQSSIGSIGRNRSEQVPDPQTAFREFGDHQANRIVHEPQNEKPITIKKYIPTSHGLVAVEVPIEDHLEDQRRRSSLRRSTSSNSLSVSRQNSLNRRANLQSQNNSQQRRHSSLTNSTAKSTQNRARQVDDQPLIQTHLQEETEQELTQDIVRPLRIPRDEYVKKPAQVDVSSPKEQNSSPQIQKQKPIEAEKPVVTQESVELKANGIKGTPVAKTIVSDHKHEVETLAASGHVERPDTVKGKEDGMTNTIAEEKVEKTDIVVEKETQKPEALVREETEKHDVVVEKEIEKPEVVVKQEAQKPNIVIEEETEILVGSNVPIDPAKASEIIDQVEKVTPPTNEGSTDELFDASDHIEPKLPGVSSREPESSTEQARAPTLAQHLRAVNPYLNQTETAASHREDATDVQDSNKSDNKALFKVPSPMKSALKKTNTQSSATSSVYSENSPANQAYLSLTTAENTRLNAKLASSENLVQRQNSKHLTRPHSVANPTNYRSVSPSPRESARTKRLSAVQKPVTDNRQSVYKQTNEQSKNPATAAARTSATNNRVKRESVKNKALEHIRTQNDAAKKENKKSKDVSDSILYPREPPQKRSSFEKNRNQDTQLGFKKLSLRDEGMTEPGFQHSNDYRSNIPTTPKKPNAVLSSQEANQAFLENSGWKSRFHDSDSDDDAAPFSSTGTSRSTQPTTTSTNVESSAGGNKGFSIFKNKGKPQNENPAALVPPQPAFIEEERSSANTTPNKVNKKWSRLSLRSSSTTDATEAKGGSVKKTATPEKRYHSNSKLEGFSYDGMKERTFRDDRVASANVDSQTGKKKKKFGTKLKKLFGREK